MRDASTYRGARRNHYRDHRMVWGDQYAIAANITAKLDERRKQCAEAMDIALMAVTNMVIGGERRAVVAIEALRDYWLKQKRTRVVARILFELGPAIPAKAAVA